MAVGSDALMLVVGFGGIGASAATVLGPVARYAAGPYFTVALMPGSSPVHDILRSGIAINRTPPTRQVNPPTNSPVAIHGSAGSVAATLT